MPNVTELARYSTHVFAAVDNVLVNVFFGLPALSDLSGREAWLAERRASGEPWGMLSVLDRRAGTILPTREHLAASRRQGDRYGDGLTAISVVLESDELHFRLLRTTLRGARIMVRRPFELDFFEHVSDGASWLTERVPGAPSTARLREAMAELRNPSSEQLAPSFL